MRRAAAYGALGQDVGGSAIAHLGDEQVHQQDGRGERVDECEGDGGLAGGKGARWR